DDWLFRIEWERKPREAFAPDRNGVAGRRQWLMFSDLSPAAQLVASRIEERGDACIQVTLGETYWVCGPQHFQIKPTAPSAYRRLLRDVFADETLPFAGIIHLWSFEALQGTPDDSAAVMKAQELVCDSVLFLMQALAHAGWKEHPRVWLVTGGAQPM